MKNNNHILIDAEHTSPRLIRAGHFLNIHPYTVVRSKGTHDWLLIYTIRGSGRFGHGKEEFISHRGDIIIYPQTTPQDYRIAPDCKEWEILWAHFIPWPHWQELMAWPLHFFGMRYVHVGSHNIQKLIESALSDMNKHAMGPFNTAELSAINSLEKALILSKTYHADSSTMRLDPRVAQALTYICENFVKPITLDAIAKNSALSGSRLSHLFRSEVSMSPMEYVEQQRMRQARQLLEISGLGIAQIAFETGYESQSYFSRRFKMAAGMYPREYRRRFGAR